MSKPNSLDNYRNQLDQLFNFSFTEHRQRQSHQRNIAPPLTPAEKRGLGMWMGTVLETHSEQFVHALKHCRLLSIGELNLYMVKHYGHLKNIIRYYVIGALIDYRKIGSEGDIDKQCIFLNIVVEQLASRFFRESQWLHKISHLPGYQVFSLFDRFCKGYTTLREIISVSKDYNMGSTQKNTLEESDKYAKKAERLLLYKLSRNLQEKDKDPRIYQQNFLEIMNRANLLTFQAGFTHGELNATSIRYIQISQEIVRFNSNLETRQLMNQSEELARSRKQQEELELLREHFRIKQNSDIMTRREYGTEQQSGTARSTANKENFMSTPYSTQLSKHHPQSDYATHHVHTLTAKSLQQPPNLSPFQKNAETVPKKKENTQLLYNCPADQILFENVKKVESKKSKLSLRKVIMDELEAVREQKRKNHLQLLRYI